MRLRRLSSAAPLLLAPLAACGDEPTGEGGGVGAGRPEIVVDAPRVALVPGGSPLEVPIVVRGAAGIEGIEVQVTALSEGIAAAVEAGASDTVAVVRLAAAESALPNPAQLRVRAVVPGRNVSDVTFVVPVRSGEAQLVTFAWCPTTVPALVAARDAGDARWTRIVPDAEGRARFAFPSGRGALAWVRTDGATEAEASSIRTQVAYATAPELRALSGRETGACEGERRSVMTGTASGLAAHGSAQFALGTGWDVISDAARATFRLEVAGDAPQSLYAVHGRWEEGPWRMYADRIVVRRGVPVRDGGTVAPVDFAGAEAFAPALGQVGVFGLFGDTAYVYGSLRNAVQVVSLSSREEVTEGATVPVAMLPAGRLADDERHAASAAAFRANTDGGLRGVVRWFTGTVPPSLTMGMRAGTPVPSGARLLLAVQAEYAGSAWATFHQHDDARLREVIVVATAGYRDGALEWELTPPALGAVSGVPAWWALEPGPVTVGWGVDSEAAWWLWTLPPDGTTTRTASDERTFAWDGARWGASAPAAPGAAARAARTVTGVIGPVRSAIPGWRP